MNKIVKMYFGSHLYGTNTPESDIDYKGIYLPTFRNLCLNRVKKSIVDNTKNNSVNKNSKDDIDCEIYSIHYFINLACQGQTVALDMLHAPENMIIEKSPIWDSIVKERKRFYTKNLNAFIGYARRQASKYGIKGSRLSDTKNVIDTLKRFGTVKLRCFWTELPDGEHLKMLGENVNGVREYQVCGKTLQETQSAENALKCLEKFYNEYGERAKQAEKNEGIDWKAVSHACRAAIQVRELFLRDTITFPLQNAKLLKEIKSGILSYSNFVAPYLEDLMTEVEELSKNSHLPEKVDTEYWDDFIFGLYL